MTMRNIWNAACGREPEPWWMALSGCAIALFGPPALVVFLSVAYTPTQAEIKQQYAINSR